MNKIIKYISAVALTSLLLVVIFSQTSFAETVTANSIEQQIGRLTTVLEKMLVREKEPKDMTQLADASTNAIDNPTCVDGYMTWKGSNTYKKTAKWNVDFIPSTGVSNNSSYNPKKEYFTDINGDGLPDYIFARRDDYLNNNIRNGGTCVYLNNGSGFDLVYKCYVRGDFKNSTQNYKIYYGDCAG